MSNHSLLYVRVSSKEQQIEGYSLDAQEKLGREYAKKNNLKIVKMWKGHESAWGKERKAFSEMLAYAKSHKNVKHIIFDVTDRMTRNDMDKIRINVLRKEYDKVIHFSRSNKRIDKDSRSDDEFMLDIEVAVAKKQSNDISMKSKMGMLEKAEQGIYPSTAPYGYKNNKIEKRIDIDPEKAPLIKEAFSMFETGRYSLQTLIDELRKKGYKSKTGKKLAKGRMYGMLINPIYYGMFIWNGIEYKGKHTPLISKQTYDTVQVLLGRKKLVPKKQLFVYADLMVCDVCGCKIIGEQKFGKYTYYHCTYSKGKHDKRGSIREDRLHSEFERVVDDAIVHDYSMQWLLACVDFLRSEDDTDSLKNNHSTLLNERKQIQDRLSRLYDDKADGNIEESFWESKQTQYKKMLLDIDLKLSETDEPKAINYDKAKTTLENINSFVNDYKNGNQDEKLKVLNLIASKYRYVEENVIADYNFPFNITQFLPNRHAGLPQRNSKFISELRIWLKSFKC